MNNPGYIYHMTSYNLMTGKQYVDSRVLCEQCAALALMQPHQEVACLGYCNTDINPTCDGCGSHFDNPGQGGNHA